MDHRNLFGIAAIILSGAVFVHSLNAANAFPQGPNVSLGSNPIENFYGNSGTINFQNDFIITTIMTSDDDCSPSIDGTSIYPITNSRNPFYYHYQYPTASPFHNGTARLRISSGSTLTLTDCGHYYIQGDYNH